MKQLVISCLVFAGWATLAPDDVLGQKRAAKQGGNVLAAGAQEYALLSKYKEMVGTVQSVDKDSLVLRVDYDHPVQKANANTPRPKVNSNANPKNAKNQLRSQTNHIQQQIHKIQQDRAALARAKNPAQHQQKLAQLARDEQNLQMQLYRFQVQQAQVQQQQLTSAIRTQTAKTSTAHDFIDFDLPFMTATAVRRMSLAVEYDEKGFPKEAEAKTSTTMPGYSAKMEDLRPGEKVKVYLAAPKTSAAKKDASGAIIELGNRPQARMVVILEDNNTGLAANNKKKKVK